MVTPGYIGSWVVGSGEHKVHPKGEEEVKVVYFLCAEIEIESRQWNIQTLFLPPPLLASLIKHS